MEANTRKWIAIGKQQGKLQIRSHLFVGRKRNWSNTHSQLSEVTQVTLMKIRSAKQLLSRQTVEQDSGNKFQLELSSLQCQQKSVPINILIQSQQVGANKFIRQQKPYGGNQQQANHMNHNHVPFYLRNQDFKVHYQNQPSERSNQGSHFGEEINQSVVLEAQDLSMDIPKPQHFNQQPGTHIPDEQSEIIESMSFASSSKLKQQPKPRQPIVHYQRGYRNGLDLINKLRENNYYQPAHLSDNRQNKVQQKIKLNLKQLNQMVENLKVINTTVIKEIEACRGSGKLPLFIKNQQFTHKLTKQFKEIMAQYVKSALERELNKWNQGLSRLLNVAQEKGLLNEGALSGRQIDNNKKIQKIIKKLQENRDEIQSLRENLSNAQTQCEKTSGVLLNKLEEISGLKEELGKTKEQLSRAKEVNQKSNTSMASQQTATFSPEFEKLLRDKDLRSKQMQQQIQELTERNQQLMDDKQKLQEEVFTLEQRVIGVEMEVQERVRQGLEEMRPGIEEQVKSQLEMLPKGQQQHNGNQFFLETIDTLSQEIKDLTEKCKYYEKYIRDQEKTSASSQLNTHQQHLASSKSSLSINHHTSQQTTQNSQNHKQFEEVLNKRRSELDLRESTLLSIQNELTFKDKKLKELEARLTKQAQQFEKREKLCLAKEEELEKYLQQLNAREEELYVWEKQLNEEDKKLTRKSNELQRERALLDNHKLSSFNMIPQYPLGQVVESRNICSHNNPYPPYPGSYMQKPMVSSLQRHQNQELEQTGQYQGRVYYDRPYTYHPYQPTYEQQTGQVHSYHRGFEKSHHNMSQQNIRYHHANDLDDSKIPQHNLNHTDLEINELRENRLSQKQKTQSMRVRGEPNASNIQQAYSKVTPYRPPDKLYLSSTYDKKSQLVQEILAKRKHNQLNYSINTNNNSFSNRALDRPDSRSPISGNRNPLGDLFKKSDVRKIKSPLKNQPSLHTLKQVTQRKLKERYQRKKMFQKPSKDMSQIYRPSGGISLQGMGSPKSYIGKSFGFQGLNQEERQYTPRSFTKSSLPGAQNINQKLQKLKEEIKREVRDLE